MEPEGQRFAGAFGTAREAAAVWLAEASAAAGVTLAAPAADALLAWLTWRLTACAHTALDEQWRRAGRAVSPEAFSTAVARPEAWDAFLSEFPVVARLLTLSEVAWRRRVGALFTHLARDAALLGLGELAIEDVHAHGGPLQARATTLALTFAGGARLVYREKNLGLGAWFMELCGALNAAGLSVPLHVRAIRVRQGCSWDAFVEAAPAHDPEAIRRWFTRAGMLVRLVERLAGTDFHAQNVVTAGEYPVPIDLETFFAPVPAQATPAVAALLRSPLRSSLLGAVLVGEPGRRALQLGGLNRGGRMELPFRTPRLRAPEDPRGGLESVFAIEVVAATLPAPPGDHAGELEDGYREMDALLACLPDLPARLAAARGLPVRDLGGGGASTHMILAGSLDPELLRSDAARDAWLARQPVTGDERAALRDLELPRLERPAEPTVAAEPLELEARVELVRTAVALLDDGPALPRPRRSGAASDEACAVEIGDLLLATSFTGPEWHGTLFIPWAGARVLDLLPGDLLSGHAGLAIVLASLHRVTGLPRFRIAAHGALEKVPPPGPARWPGGFVGLGGAIYALARCGQALAEQALVDQAATYLQFAPRGALRDGPWDVVTGVAGLLLGALALDETPRDVLDALAAAWERGLDPPPHLEGGLPACLPDLHTGVAVALGRAGVRVPAPSSGNLAWRLELDPGGGAGAEAARVLTAGGGEPLDELDLALAALRATGDEAFLSAARERALALRERRARTGHWFPGTRVAERHNLSAVTGLGAVAHALLAVSSPRDVTSIRRME